MICPFSNCDNQDDNPNFDEPEAHLIITVSPIGHTHIHMPFDDPFILRKMVNALIVEMRKNGIDYQLPPEKKGDATNDGKNKT